MRLLFALQFLLVTTALVGAAPWSFERRDGGNQPICVTISPILRDAADLAAKVRPRQGVCKPDEIIRSETVNNRISLLAMADDPYVCAEDTPCRNGACCAKSGHCGYGEDYCGTNGESPNDVCWSNCDAHAECGRHSDPPGKTCPLNVCCSQYGFCGTTSEFCSKGTGEEDTGCQSNCDQPGSGASGGDVQKRVIGYYEVWNRNKPCIGMGIKDIPVESITHLYYSFGYIDPNTFDIVPMNDGGDSEALPLSTFSEIAGLKKKNPKLKVVLALGGWTFNDNHTIWQPVFSDMVSTQENREWFTLLALQFCNRYGFDGLDFDWEYPGAGDRGGHPEDGVNFTKLLELIGPVLRNVIKGFEISFTAPTSYWYLRNFDLKATAEAVDYVNVMSYDLHGIWDSENPIGSQVLAHTNLTEIQNALNLLWRNDVNPAKVNMGIGFYGRAYQLADPGCSLPGCLFKGGATAGPCTGESGILSYSEIMDIKDKYNLSPVYIKEHAVKYITWNQDQWVSYDDRETIQQKIKFANHLGLGGLLIWAIDLDTPNLDALSAVIWPETIGFRYQERAEDTWEDVSQDQCYSTPCGVSQCDPGYIETTRFACGDGEFPFNSPDGTQSLCCPLASAPDMNECTWRGGESGAYCNGQCHGGEVAVASSKWGDGGWYCVDGRKFLCCASEVQQPICRWTECGEDCGSNEDELTWRNGVCHYSGSDEQEKLCCNKQQQWTNCEWHGKPGNCFDNHCDTGWQVAITNSDEGEGHDCGAHARKRTFCCDLPEGESPFTPVPLEFLFPDPPPKESTAVDFKLKVDPTFGGSRAEENSLTDPGPEDAPFGFIVMTSPQEIQQSLDRRDGSHWEVFDCLDATTIGEHTVRMTCTDLTENSNCADIHLGHGALGTIIQMPPGCGPGKYAVLKHLEPSANQSSPGHLARRGIVHDTIYDLTFDYDFKRVPRDLGDTLMRIDYSNDGDYWNGVVDRAADTKKKKRSLVDRRNHRRWLEEEWRDDAHFDGLSHEEFHKRWFGSGIIEWLRNLIGTIEKTVDFSHSYQETFVLKLVDEQLTCPNFEAHLDIHAEATVKAELSYGFTLIAKLDDPIDFSQSFLYFRTKGEAEAAFIVDAAITYGYNTDEVLLLAADKFGAAFTVPGIVTIGPNFEIYGQIEGAVTIGANFETRVKLGTWEVQQTYPVPSDDYNPGLESNEDSNFAQPQAPEVEWSVGVSGYLTAHVRPKISFGIKWHEPFFSIKPTTVSLVADGFVTFHAEAETGSSGTSACIGVDAGTSIYAEVRAPDTIQWALPRTPYYLMPEIKRQIWPSQQDGPMCWSSSSSSQTMVLGLDAPLNNSSGEYGAGAYLEVGDDGKVHAAHLEKRAKVYGPLLPVLLGLECPGGEELEPDSPCPDCTLTGSSEDLGKRQEGVESCLYDPETYQEGEEICRFAQNGDIQSRISERSITEKWLAWKYGSTSSVLVGAYPTCSSAINDNRIDKYYGFDTTSCTADVTKRTSPGKQDYVTEHIFEAQTLKRFMDFLLGDLRNMPLPAGYSKGSMSWVSEELMGILTTGFLVPGWNNNDLWEQMCLSVGHTGDPDLMVIAEKDMNGKKGVFFKGGAPEAAIDPLTQTLHSVKVNHKKVSSGPFSLKQMH
ncbi:hypothetical protein BJX65DRAFT_68290 [Aspergillus insuetus]